MHVLPQVAAQPFRSPSASLSRSRSLPLPWLLALLLGFAGLLLLSASLLWRIWTSDGLRSIGIYFPLISAVLTARVWKRLNWEMRGSWWGLLPLYYAIIMARAGGNSLQLIAFNHAIGFTLLPLGLTVFAYGSGVVLLLGGTRVWRASLFPLALLLFVNPVPKAFQLVDLPLQFFSARVAQSFASLIGVHPDVNQLRLMFAPGFGMFIAPGCDGIRGAVTMGYLALVLAYVYHFAMPARFFSVTAAIALGYVFNLVRLCFLVLFYRAALRFPILQPHGTGADYLIGGLLFLIAAILFGKMIRWHRRHEISNRDPMIVAGVLGPGAKNRAFLWKAAVASLVIMVSCFSSVRVLASMASERAADAESKTLSADILPPQIGQYHLLRTWTDKDWLNHLAYHWQAYSNGAVGDEIDVALWFGAGVHYPAACHVSRGQRPAWSEVSALSAARGGSATFAFYLYDEPNGQTLEATSVCDADGCSEHAVLPNFAGFAFTGMGLKSLLFHPASTPLPVLIRIRSENKGVRQADKKDAMLREVREFVSQLNIDSLIAFAQSRQPQADIHPIKVSR